MKIALGLALYTFGALATLIFNFWIIEGAEISQLIVARNAILWPVFLPILIVLKIVDLGIG